MKPGTKVNYLGCTWFIIKKINDEYLLRSINKNVNNILATAKYVKKFEVMKE